MCVYAGEGAAMRVHVRPPARPGAGRKEAHSSQAGVSSSGAFRYAEPHKGTLSLACAMNSRALAGGVSDGPFQPPCLAG